MVLLLGVLLSPAGALAVQTGLSALAMRETTARTEVAAIVLNDMDRQRNAIARLRDVTRTVAANPILAWAGASQCGAALRSLHNRFQDFTAIAIINSHANVACASTLTFNGRALALGPLMEHARAHNAVEVGFLKQSTLLDQPLVAAVAPFATSRARDRRFAVALSSSRSLLTRVANAAGQAGSYAALVSGSGEILQMDGLDAHGEEARSLARNLAHGPIGIGLTPFHVGRTWAVAAALDDQKLYLVQGWRAPPLGVDEALRSGWAVAAPLLMWVIAVAGVWIAVEVYVTRPLSMLESAARAYARGDDTIGADAFRMAAEEIASLRRTLAAMAKTLRRREQLLVEALAEERALLREVNHRVMNNLQIMASILSIQARASESEEQAWGLARALDRVQLLSLAHGKIYRSGALREIQLDDFVSEIGTTLAQSRRATDEKISLAFDLTPVSTTVDNAVPLAFLIGESLSYVFDALSGEMETTVRLSLESRGMSEIVITIAANARDNIFKVTATPRRMIEAFARQLSAQIEYGQNDQFLTRIRFRNSEANEV